MTFKKWLSMRIRDSTPIGDLARDMARDPNVPVIRTHAALMKYLHGATNWSDVHEAGEYAWEAYEEER